MAAHGCHRQRTSIDDGTLARYLAQQGSHLDDLVDIAGGILLQGIEAHEVTVLAAAQHNLVGRGGDEGELIVGGETFGLCAGGLRPVVDEGIIGVEGEHDALAGDDAILRLHGLPCGVLDLVALGIVDEHLRGELHLVGREACRVGDAAEGHVAGIEVHRPAVLGSRQQSGVLAHGLLLALRRRVLEDIISLGGAGEKDDGKDPPPSPSREGGELLARCIKYGS